MKDELISTITARLTETLPKVSGASLHSLASLLASPSKKGGSLKIISSLLIEGCPSTKLQAAIMHGRDILMQERMPEFLELSEPQRTKQVRKLVEHFDRMQAALLKEIDARWISKVKQVKSRLAVEGQARLLSNARNQWLKEGYVELYNYFLEIPVYARARLREVREHGISVSRSRELVRVIAAGEHRRIALIRLPDRELCLRTEVEAVHGQAVHLRDAGILQVVREKRRHIRVQCEESLAVKLRRKKGPKWQACLRDYSAMGLGIICWGKLPGKVGDQLYCSMRIRRSDIKAKGRISWISSEGGQTRIGMELDVDHITNQLLQKEAAFRQEQILLQLKLRGVPDCLQP